MDTILRIRTTGCMRNRQSSYEIVGDCTDKGGDRYQPLPRFILQEVLARRRVMFMLPVLTYDVSYKLFWNWIGVVRFQVVYHKVCSDKRGLTLSLWFFFAQILSLWSLSIWIQIISTENKLVNQTRHWNQMAHGRDLFMEKRFFCEKNTLQANSCKKMRRGQDIFDRILMGTLSCWCSM